MGELVKMPGGEGQGVDRGFTVTKANFHFLMFYVLLASDLLLLCCVLLCKRKKKIHVVACCVMFFAILQPQLFFLKYSCSSTNLPPPLLHFLFTFRRTFTYIRGEEESDFYTFCGSIKPLFSTFSTIILHLY